MCNLIRFSLSLICIFPFAVHAAELEYSLGQKRAIYTKHRIDPTSKVPFLTSKDRAWQELNMPTLIGKINRTSSVAGLIEFEKLLEPTTNLEELNERRQVLEFLIANNQLHRELKDLVETFTLDYEGLFLHFLDADAQVQFLQEKDLFNLLGQRSSLYQLGLQGFMTVLLAQNIAYEGRQVYRNFGDVRNGQNGRLLRGFIGYNLFGQAVGMAWGSYYTIGSIVATIRKILAADAYVLQAAQGLSVLEEATALLSKAPQLQQSEFAKAFQRFNAKQGREPSFKRVLDATSDRLANDDSWLSPLSIIYSLDTYDDLRKSSRSLAKAMQAMGKLDAYLSVVTLYNEYKEKGLPVSLANFDQAGPMGFAFEGLTNPVVDKSIPNDFRLGLQGVSHHAVLTGPHGCGKTTIMKSAAYGIILAQSILVVPSESARVSPINGIKTYFNIGDNIAEGLSSFMAEHQRMDELRVLGDNLGPNARELILIDEPYAKTIQAIGEPRVTDFLRALTPKANLSIILATHFEEPSRLEGDTHGVVKNFQPEVDAALEPTYKIIEGAADWWFKDVERRERFIAQLIKRQQLKQK